MISLAQVDELKPEDQQAPDPPEEQQMLIVGEKKRPWLEPLLRGVAIVVSLMCGIASVYLVVSSYAPWLELGFENSSADHLASLRTMAFLLVGIVALVCAVLFRSWWAILVIPLALGLGVILTNFLSNLIVPDLLGYDDVGFGVGFDTAICIMSAVIGASFGSLIGTAWKKRQQL
jgi:hypothetical protein